MSDDAHDLELTDDEIDELQKILERNREVGANEHTMETEDDDRDGED